MTKDELRGFKAAVDALGHEGDYREVDWSIPYRYLVHKYQSLKEHYMPSKSPAQKKTMAAIAHGWRPPKGSKVSKMPKKVAKEFNREDAKKRRRK